MRKINVIKRDSSVVAFDGARIKTSLKRCFKACKIRYTNAVYEDVLKGIEEMYPEQENVSVEDIQDIVEVALMGNYPEAAKEYILYRKHKENVREWVETKEDFIRKYKGSSNTANATVDDNSNVASKNIGILNNEIHKEDNIQISRRLITNKLKELFPDFDSKQYIRDLESHVIYKNDESSFGSTSPYCVALSMYPFINEGIKGIGGLSAKPKNLDSFCGMFVNMIFAVASQFAGAVAVPEAICYLNYFISKEFGDDYYLHSDDIVNPRSKHPRTIRQDIHQRFQQIIYSINQPAAARGMQSAFVNFSYFDKPFFDGMFGKFQFPDGSSPVWESTNWLQKEFMMWFNEERKRCILTFPVESFAMVYQNGEFLDKDSAEFVAQEYARGHSFFTYISDTVDSLSSCCRLKNKIQTKEFNFTNGNIGVMTGSKSVISHNLSRIIQDWAATVPEFKENGIPEHLTDEHYNLLCEHLGQILDRVYKYHIAYNELLWDMKDSHLLPVYDAGFIDLNKQYLTLGLNGLNQAAEFLGMKCNDNPDYMKFCQKIFGYIQKKNKEASVEKFNGHKLSFNTEQVPAESLAIKNYNWDKEDGYWVPDDTNLYASYIFKPNDPNIGIFEKIRLHGENYIGDYLDGGSAAHLNLEEHLSVEQYRAIIKYAADNKCSYFTFNIPMTECKHCGHIVNALVDTCPVCGSEDIQYYTRIIGYLTAVPHWSAGRQEEFKTRVFHKELD